jgi:hypothetical protein
MKVIAPFFHMIPSKIINGVEKTKILTLKMTLHLPDNATAQDFFSENMAPYLKSLFSEIFT